MKQPHLDSVGYRIRKARKDLGVSQKEFAELIGVTKNYVGVIERGDEGKEPSSELLVKIAEVTGKRYQWLLTGEEDTGSLGLGVDLAEFEWDRIDIRLLISLLLGFCPDISIAEIAEMLCVSPDDIHGILRGETIPFDTAWNNVLPILAMKLDMRYLYSKVRTLTELWIGWQAKEHSEIVMEAMEAIVLGTWGDVSWTQVMEGLISQGRDIPIRFRVRECYMKQAPYSRWTCIHLSSQPQMTFRANELVRDLLRHATGRQKHDQITLAFADKTQYDFYLCEIFAAASSMDRIRCEISVAYVDPNEREVVFINSI